MDSVFNGKATMLNRMRLACTFYDSELEKKGEGVNDGEFKAKITKMSLTYPRIQIGR